MFPVPLFPVPGTGTQYSVPVTLPCHRVPLDLSDQREPETWCLRTIPRTGPVVTARLLPTQQAITQHIVQIVDRVDFLSSFLDIVFQTHVGDFL